MYTIGIDSSTTNTAIVVLEEGELDSFRLISPKSKDILQRSQEIVLECSKFLDTYSGRNIKLGIEGASFSSRGMRDKLTMLLGAIYYNASLCEFDVSLLPPTTIKKKFSDNGRADKDEMATHVPDSVLEKFRGESTKIDDLVDAYAIARIV